jgi:serine/threonine protein kinase/WD40 repeat protein
MNEPVSECDPIEELAESFVKRYRRGERPSLTEYAARYPALADRIRELFPALIVIEEVGSVGGGAVPAAGAGYGGCAPPAQLGEYHILREIGRGGMGIVYEAVQGSLGRHVALKVLSTHAAIEPLHIERFRREAQAAARLHHTNIVPVFGVGEHHGLHYYAMQFIHGQSLDSVLRDLRRLRRDLKSPARVQADQMTVARSVQMGLLTGRFEPGDTAATQGDSKSMITVTATLAPRRESEIDGSAVLVAGDDSELSAQSEAQYFQSVARVGVQVADALAHAHQQGIVHRDIKPSNLLLDTRGTVWVTDFGLAKATGADELTNPGDIVGTLRYMAPERFRGVTDSCGDIYSLGATLYEMATLRPVFDDSDRLRLMQRLSHESPLPPRKLHRTIPCDLETIILKAIDKDSKERFQTASELADELRRFLADRLLQIRRASRRERLWRWCRRNPALAGLISAVALLLMTVAMVASVGALRLRSQLELTARAENNATHRLYRSLVDQARASRVSRRVGQRFDGLLALRSAASIARSLHLREDDFLALRNQAIACLALPDLRVEKEWPGCPAGTNLSFDDRLARYVRVDLKGNVTVREVAGDAEICRFRSGLRPGWPTLSPDGSFLLLRSGLRCELWQIAGREARQVALDDSDCIIGAFSRDSGRLALVRPDGSISVYELPAVRRVRRLAAGPVPVPVSMAYHPGGSYLALASRELAQVRDVQTGKVTAEFPYPQGEAPNLAWHPDGKILATVGGDNIIELWDVATGKRASKLQGCTYTGISIAFDRTGLLLASTGWEAMLRLWDARTGQELLRMPRKWLSAPIQFSPDGHLLGPEVADGKVRFWAVTAGREYRTLVPDPVLGGGPHHCCSIHPDGRLLAVGMDNGVGLWDVRTATQCGFIRHAGARASRFEPSGALLVTSPSGLLRFPVGSDSSSPGRVRIGPPGRLPMPASAWESVAWSGDGRLMAIPQGWGAEVWDQRRPGQPVARTRHADTRYVAVSPDGRWLVTGSHNGTAARVWDVHTGELVKELLPEEGQMGVGFSPDGKWLATTGGGLRLWSVSSWLDTLRLGGTISAFSPDGSLFAAETGQGSVRLVDPATGREYARLEGPNHDRAKCLAFTPDGAQLVATTDDSQSIHVWDLRAIRRALAEMGLDWDQPPYTPSAPESEACQPLHVEVLLGELANPALTSEQQARQTIERYRRVHAEQPNSAVALNNLAWGYLIAPEALRDLKAAVPLAEKAVRLANGQMYRNTLGLAYYRAGRYREAVATLEPNLQSQEAWALPLDLYLLAMSHQWLGEAERARVYFTWAARWSPSHANLSSAELEDLRRFRAEAEAVLGVETIVAEPAGKAPAKPK